MEIVLNAHFQKKSHYLMKEIKFWTFLEKKGTKITKSNGSIGSFLTQKFKEFGFFN
jgi:hypothetical protein